MAGKFEIYKDTEGEYRYRLKAANGEIVATGESYKTKAGVREGIEAVKRAAAGPRSTTRPTDRSNRPGMHRAWAVLFACQRRHPIDEPSKWRTTHGLGSAGGSPPG